MTDNGIMKNVRCCADHYCKKCSLQGKPNCTNTLLSFAWNAMYDQKAEIERLNAEVKEKSETIDFLKKQCTDWCDNFCKVKSEAIKEFAERLKETPIKYALPLLGLTTKDEIENYFNDVMLQVRDAIDNIAKEMTE